MKRNVFLSIVVVMLILGVGISVPVVYGESIYVQKLMKQGYTEQDILEMKAVHFLSDENVKPFIMQKYDELKDWKKVREYYNVDEEKYEDYIFGKKMHQKVIDSVPEYIFDEMSEKGWTKSEISNFVNRTNISKIDWDYAWKECKAGRTIEDVVEEKMAVDSEKSRLDTEFVTGEMTIKEYETKVNKILNKGVVRKTSKMAATAALEADALRTNVRERHKKACGITDAEIKYCELQGITNPMDMYQAKHISNGNKISFEKVVDSKVKNKDWGRATAEVLNISYDEYKRRNEMEEVK